MTNKFRNATNSRYLKGLFYETTDADKSTVVYTLKDVDHQGFPSLYQIYMEVGDPTEYLFATATLDGWEHWEMLTNCTWFKPYVDRWRRELELKIRSDALIRIREEAKNRASANSYAANKFLLEKGWAPKETGSRGRPKKEDVRKEAEVIALADKRIKNDYERIFS